MIIMEKRVIPMMNKSKTILMMIGHELRLSLRSKWLLNFTILFMAMAALFYFYGIKPIEADPTDVKYGLESVGVVDTGTVDPAYFGLEEISSSDNVNDEVNQHVGYNRAIAMLMNLSLWLIPIICLILGANSIIADKEGGRLSLYKTYQMPYFYYLFSKFIALSTSLIASLGISYGIFGVILSITGNSIEASFFLTFFLLNILLVITFSALSLFVGAVSVTRMQGLSLALFIWSFLVFVYEFIIFSIVDLIPYAQKLNSMLILILLNPIESIRVWSIEQLNADYIFGPEFLILNEWGTNGILTNYIMISILFMILIVLFVSNQVIKIRG